MASINQHPSLTQGTSAQTLEHPIGDSSFLQHVSYNPTTLQMTVTMKTGAQYIHYYVYPAMVDAMMQSPSKGKFYTEAVKGKNPSAKIVNKNVGQALRNPAKGPKQHERPRVRR